MGYYTGEGIIYLRESDSLNGKKICASLTSLRNLGGEFLAIAGLIQITILQIEEIYNELPCLQEYLDNLTISGANRNTPETFDILVIIYKKLAALVIDTDFSTEI